MYSRILRRMRELVRLRQYVMTTHADEEADDDGLSVLDVESAILTGSIIERQKDRETGEWKYVVRGKRPYLKKECCIRVVENPIRSEPQENNRHRFWAEISELEGRYLRVITLDDKVTIHNAFLDRRFKP